MNDIICSLQSLLYLLLWKTMAL